MHGNMMALAVVRSENVTLKDFSWDFGVPTVTEMTVTGMGEENGREYTDFLIPEIGRASCRERVLVTV